MCIDLNSWRRWLKQREVVEIPGAVYTEKLGDTIIKIFHYRHCNIFLLNKKQDEVTRKLYDQIVFKALNLIEILKR